MSTLSQKYVNILLNFTNTNVVNIENIKNYKQIYELSKNLNQSEKNATEFIKKIEFSILSAECYNKIINSVLVEEYLLLDSKPRIPRNIYLECNLNLGLVIKTIAEYLVNPKLTELNKNESNRNTTDTTLSNFEESLFNKSLQAFINVIQVDFENKDAILQIISIYTKICYFYQHNHQNCLIYLNKALLFDPGNPVLHYNLAHIYQKINKSEESVIHYKLSNKLCNKSDIKLMINNYNGIASIYRSVKKWPESLHYLLKANLIDDLDPDINNQLGVVYTELRRTDLALPHFELAIKHYQKTFISTDSIFFLAEVYLNFGFMHSYNGNNNKSIECYNLSLKTVPKFSLPFQNKLMNLCYISDQLDDSFYIKKQHLQINKLYKKNGHYKFDKEFFDKSDKINIGIISGDFINHPVSYFISTFLKNFDTTRFNLICYSEAILDVSIFNKNIQFKIIKGMSQELASNIVYNDNIHILLDLAGLTCSNRMDIFAYKPVPIQITYIGYPNTTGLYEMDYRITDNFCDGDMSISQQFYTEKLIALDNCFLCYEPGELPELTETPILKIKNELIIGCFNRLNKITDTVITEFNKILMSNSQIKFLFKTKALINNTIRQEFINKFDKSIRKNIIVLDCTLTHNEHLETYNLIDIAIDTFPYSGTTTSCEALKMGVPVFSLYDTKLYNHAQNVTCSILKNSDLDFYVCNDTEEIISKINILINKPIEFWKTLKQETKNKFLYGKVCNKELYMKNIQKLFIELYDKHKIN